MYSPVLRKPEHTQAAVSRSRCPHLPRLATLRVASSKFHVLADFAKESRGRDSRGRQFPERVFCSGCLSLVREAWASKVRWEQVATSPSRSGSPPTRPPGGVLAPARGGGSCYPAPSRGLVEERTGAEGTRQEGRQDSESITRST